MPSVLILQLFQVAILLMSVVMAQGEQSVNREITKSSLHYRFLTSWSILTPQEQEEVEPLLTQIQFMRGRQMKLSTSSYTHETRRQVLAWTSEWFLVFLLLFWGWLHLCGNLLPSAAPQNARRLKRTHLRLPLLKPNIRSELLLSSPSVL